MKKFVASLLVLAMVLALAGTAMAACSIKAGMWVEFKKDSNAYTAARSSKKTSDVVQKGSTAKCDKVCGKYALLTVNKAAGTQRWFKVENLEEATDPSKQWVKVIWARGGKGMSTFVKSSIGNLDPAIKGLYVKVSGYTNLRKNPGMKIKSQGVVRKGDLLKLAGRYGLDDRDAYWVEVCHKGKKLWLSAYFIVHRSNGAMKFYDKDGKCVIPVID